MTDLNGTASAPSSATIDLTTDTRPNRRGKREVDHMYWAQHMKAATEMGVDMRSLCGVWTKSNLPEDVVPVVGGLIPLTDPEDCKRCVKILQVRLRRNWEARFGK